MGPRVWSRLDHREALRETIGLDESGARYELMSPRWV